MQQTNCHKLLNLALMIYLCLFLTYPVQLLANSEKSEYPDLQELLPNGCTSVLAAKPQKAEFLFRPQMGIEISTGPFSKDDFSKYQIFELGHGDEGRIFRLISRKNGTSTIIKIFNSKEYLDRTISAFSVISDATDATSALQPVKYRKIDDVTLQVENIFGQTLKDLIKEDPVLGLKLLEIYKPALSSLGKGLESASVNNPFPATVDIYHEKILVAFMGLKPEVAITIKLDNIVVDAHNLKLYIIDPQ